MLNIVLIHMKPKKSMMKLLMFAWQNSNLFLIGFLQVKYLKRSMMLYLLMMIYSFLMKILVKSHFLLMKWELLVQILIKITLMITKILLEIILKPSPCYNKFEKHKSCKKDISKELKPAAWHSRWWGWCLSEDEKKGTEPIFYCKVGKCQKCF